MDTKVICLILFMVLCSCQTLNHNLIHPIAPPLNVVTWSEDVKSGQLLVHLEWAKPVGEELYPTVLVHPEAGKTAEQMGGVIWDLAQNGYLAVAVDYKRLIGGKYKKSLFAWREEKNVTAALEIIEANPLVDRKRIEALGFSQGGVFSLLIAAAAPEKIQAVVAYYPVTDFEGWLFSYERTNWIHRSVFRVIRWYFRKESGAETEEEFRMMLKKASPIHQVERIRAPVLLIHGELDRSAPVEESRRLCDRLRERGVETELMIVPEAGHVFNFKDPQQAASAWEATIQWLSQHSR